MSPEPGADFPTSYDAVTKSISVVVCVGAAVAGAAIHNTIAAVLLALVCLLCFAYSPRSYRVTATAIIVTRLIGNIRIPLENLRALRRMDADDLSGCIRLWGSGGFFGYFGLFRTTKLGRCTWYATHRGKLVVAIGVSKTTVYSPDDVDGFLNAIRTQVPGLSDRSREPMIATADEATKNAVNKNPATSWVMLIMVLLAAAGALVVILLMLTRVQRGI